MQTRVRRQGKVLVNIRLLNPPGPEKWEHFPVEALSGSHPLFHGQELGTEK